MPFLMHPNVYFPLRSLLAELAQKDTIGDIIPGLTKIQKDEI